jgi:hypothetical protein
MEWGGGIRSKIGKRYLYLPPETYLRTGISIGQRPNDSKVNSFEWIDFYSFTVFTEAAK